MKYHEININIKEDICNYKEFYNEVLVKEFPEDQRETFDELLDTLKKQSDGFFGKSSYHVLLIQNNSNEFVGGIIFDYFYNTNSGLIEYIVTKRNLTKQNIATYAYEGAINILNKEAKKYGKEFINYLIIEVENLDKKMPANYFWEKKNFKKLKFNYIQPALSEDKDEVTYMDLGIVVDANKYNKDYILATDLKSILYDYSYYTMRIKNPLVNKSIIKMYKEIDDLSKDNNKIFLEK